MVHEYKNLELSSFKTSISQQQCTGFPYTLIYLWLIRVLKREAFNTGNVNFSRNKGLASISFLSSRSIMLLADFVSPYLDSCSFSLASQPEMKFLNRFFYTRINIYHNIPKNNLPKVVESHKLCYLLVQFLIEWREHFKIFHKDINGLGTILPKQKHTKKSGIESNGIVSKISQKPMLHIDRTPETFHRQSLYSKKQIW